MDPGRLCIVEKPGLIKVLDHNTGQVLATPFLDVSSQILTDGSAGCSALRSIQIIIAPQQPVMRLVDFEGYPELHWQL